MTDAIEQRTNMVESQIRPSDVTDRRIIAAMLEVPREAFVPRRISALAYMDRPVLVSDSAGAGRAMMEPRTLARLLQLAAIERDERVLVVGAATGYSAALAARLAGSVVALESNGTLADKAREALAAAGAPSVEVVVGPLAAGYDAGAPYDVIVLDGAVPEIPSGLTAGLAEGGRLVGIECGAGEAMGQAVLVVKRAGTLARNAAFDAAAPMLPGFEKTPEFVF